MSAHASGQSELQFANDVEAAFADGRVSLIVDPPVIYSSRMSMFEGSIKLRDLDEHRIRWVHVMSKPAGGEIRGYALIGSELRVRLPNYAGPWPEMDAAVAARIAKAEGR